MVINSIYEGKNEVEFWVGEALEIEHLVFGGPDWGMIMGKPRSFKTV